MPVRSRQTDKPVPLCDTACVKWLLVPSPFMSCLLKIACRSFTMDLSDHHCHELTICWTVGRYGFTVEVSDQLQFLWQNGTQIGFQRGKSIFI